MRSWICALFAVTWTSGQLSNEASRFESTMLGDLPGAEGFGSNGTATRARKYGAYVERVNLTKCQHYKKYLPWFYSGMVVNSRSWVLSYNHKRATSIANIDSTGGIISSSSGAWPTKTNQIFHTWEQILFQASYKDIRTTNPGTLRIQSWNAGQQIYIPLYIEGNSAWMLHIYPEPFFLANPDTLAFTDGLLWARGTSANHLYRYDINVEGLIRNLAFFEVPNYRDFVKPYGTIHIDSCTNQVCFVYADNRHLDVQGLTKGSSTELMCNDSINVMGYSWNEMKALLKREFKWL